MRPAPVPRALEAADHVSAARNNTMRQRDFYVFIHIPKCGGSTFNTILRNLFGVAYAAEYGILNNYQYNASQVKQIIDWYPDLKCLASHRLSIDLPFDHQDTSVTAITFVRNPIERFVSHYFYHRQNTEMFPETKTLDIDAYTEYLLGSPQKEMHIRSQTGFLTGSADERGIDLIREHAHNKEVLCFPLSRFDEACVTLEHMFPGDFSNCAYARRENVSTKDQELADGTFIKIRKLDFVNVDLQLFDFATEQLDRLIEEYFENNRALGEDLRDFRRRCSSLSVLVSARTRNLLRRVAAGIYRRL